MTAFYTNRLVKETINYNNSLYIVEKTGLIRKILNNQDYKLEISDETLRELLAQQDFLRNIASSIISNVNKKSLKKTTGNLAILNLEDEKLTRDARKTFEKDYNELYNNILLTNINNDFFDDLTEAIFLEVDRYNLYQKKDYCIESLLVMLEDEEKNSNINWGYIPEMQNGNNSIQNKNKRILIGVDMKGYNMPIKLHFDRKQIERFLTEYAKKDTLPVYEGDEDMNVEWNDRITTQVLMPLSKEKRKKLKEKEVYKSDYRNRFLGHIKWMMFPNRYPDYLCDHQGKRREKRYVNIKSGIINTESKTH